MSTAVAAWALAGLATLVAVFLGLRLRHSAGERADLEGENTLLKERARTAEKRSEKRGSADRRRDDETADLRRKLEKARRRASQARDEQRTDAHRIKELEERLRIREADLRGLRAEASRSPIDPPTPKPAARPVPRPQPAPAPLPRPEPAVAPPAEAEPSPAPSGTSAAQAAPPAAKVAEQVRAEAAEALAADLKAQLEKAKTAAKRYQGKARTQDKLYASIRLELEAKKDRLRAQQEELERLRALKVAFLAPPGADAAASSREPSSADAKPPGHDEPEIHGEGDVAPTPGVPETL